MMSKKVCTPEVSAQIAALKAKFEERDALVKELRASLVQTGYRLDLPPAQLNAREQRVSRRLELLERRAAVAKTQFEKLSRALKCGG